MGFVGHESLKLSPVILVREMAEALAFYEDKLRFDKVFDDAGSPGSAISYAGVARGSICIHLQTMTHGENPTMPLVRIKVTNIKLLHQEYDARGLVGATGHLEPKPWSSKDFGIYDINGAALVFYEDL